MVDLHVIVIQEHIYKKRRDSRSSSASSEKKNIIWKSTMIGGSYQVVSNVQNICDKEQK